MLVYNFVIEDRFMNSGKNLALPVDGGGVGDSIDNPTRVGCVEVWMTKVEADLNTLSDQNDMVDQIVRAVKFHLQIISGTINLQQDIVTRGYI